VTWFLLLGGAFTAWLVVVVPLQREILDNDLTLVYIGARIGLEHGWSHIYALDLQHQLFTQLRPSAVFNDGERFLSPPPVAWLVAPLTVFGAAGVIYVWLAASLIALVAAWWIAAPGDGRTRLLWLIFALAWYPVQYSIGLAQPDVIVLLAAIASSATRLSVPWTLALTITARPTPSLACSARKSSSGASGGVYGRSAA